MLFTTIRNCNNIKQLLHIKKIVTRKLHTFPKRICVVCNNELYNREYRVDIRVHSTRSDHRQKVVIEAAPKIVLEKLDRLSEKNKKRDIFKDWRSKIDPYIRLGRFDKPIGIYLLYYPSTWGIILGSLPGAAPQQTVSSLGLFLLGAALMRSSGCVVNDVWDRHVDAEVARTKNRPLVTGEITKNQAIAFLGVQLTLALGILLQFNCYSVVLGASSVLLVVTYPLAKRFTNYPQIFLGATFNWGTLLGYSAMQGNLDYAVCLPLYFAALSWTVIYDTIYAHQDKLDDLRIGLKSTAITFNKHTRQILSGTLAFSMLCFLATGQAAELGSLYYLGVLGYVGHVGRQIYTLNIDNPEDCATKFKSNSLVGLIILLGIIGGGFQKYIDNRARNPQDDSRTKSCVFS